jgi:hypothetical protein
MKGNTTGTALLGLALISATATVILSLMTISAINRQQSMQAQSKQVLEFRRSTAALVQDSILYGRKNPAILPILKEAGFEPAEQPNRR